MPARQHPFIEIAVHPAVRERFAAGAGLAVFTADADHVHWANGAAARQLGYDSIYAFMEDAAFAKTVFSRQIATTAGQIGPGRPKQNLTLRLGSGFRSVATACTLERIELPDGEPALLLALPPEMRLRDSMDRAATMIAGFDDDSSTHVAILDRDANAIAHSPTFALLGIEGAALDALIGNVEREPSRLVKRQMATRQGTFPAAIAHISDDPSLFLLFVVEPEEIVTPIAEKPAAVEVVEAPAPPPAEPVAPEAAEDRAAADASFTFDPAGRPVRFVWKIDAAGRFSEVSPEFGDAIGPNAADLVGRTFDEVATVFNLDPERTIASLMERRDTWSGKTVRWPVQGTTLTVPVDLAALPTYTRDRAFDGFRGFGIARISEAAEDPERIGTALVSPAEAEALPEIEPDDQDAETAEQAPAEPAEPAPANENSARPEDDPYRGEVPALKIVETPTRRRSDKVIDLDQHRSRGREGLSKVDQAIFHQIGAELGRRLAARREEKQERPEEPAATPVAEHVAAVTLGGPAAPRSGPAAEHVAAVSLTPAAPAAPLPDAEPVAATALRRPVTQEPIAGAIAVAEEPAAVEEPAVFWPLPQASGRAMLTRALVDGLPLPLMVQRGDVLIHANAEALRLTGYQSQDELAEAGGLDVLFAETPDAAEGTADTLTLTRADGAVVSVKARLQSIGWEDGHALLLSLQPVASPADTGEDAAARMRSAETEIDELHSILETATDGVIILDEKGTIRSMNRSASALFDYDAVETRGKPFAMLFAHESQRAILDYVSGLADNGVASVLNDGREVIGREASGGFIPLFMTIGRLRGSNGYCAVIRDITHWKRTEDELRSAKRAAETASAHKSDFLARVSHEIRTPLNAIIGFAEMMTTERFGPMGSPRYLEYAHDIGRSGRHVLDIVNDLLDISKIEAGEQEMDFVAVALNETLAETVSLLQPQANSQRVIIRTSLSTALPDVVADQRSVRQIALNLLANAIRFTPAGGQIVVSTAYDQSGRVVIRVRDTGVGMSRSELDQAMKPFRQGPTSAARQRGDGTGLGLPLTKAMVEANRAQFSIESTPGEGTLVQIVFPPQRVLAD